jgi:hypothetical protein
MIGAKRWLGAPMAKRSGYKVRIDLFIEAGAFDAEALALAKERIAALPAPILHRPQR